MFYSCVLSDYQEKYSALDLELLGFIKVIKHFKRYIYGQKFILRTDHLALKYLFSSKN